MMNSSSARSRLPSSDLRPAGLGIQASSLTWGGCWPFDETKMAASFPIVDRSHQQPDSPHTFAGLLRAHRQRPCSRTAEQRDERASPHVWMAPAWQEEM
jgi:hypothetical protein